jgi:hypothetical protein
MDVTTQGERSILLSSPKELASSRRIARRMKTPRRVLTFLTSLLAVALIASAGLAVIRTPAHSQTRVADAEAGTDSTCSDQGAAAR